VQQGGCFKQSNLAAAENLGKNVHFLATYLVPFFFRNQKPSFQRKGFGASVFAQAAARRAALMVWEGQILVKEELSILLLC